MPTYRLTLEYDGTRYHGWQEQQNARTIAGELRRALQDVAGGPIVELGGSGRTDAGVHALAQTAHLRLRGPVDAERLRREANERLPSDIHVLSAVPADERFHARHDALSRSYLYQVSRRRTALAKRYVWWVKRPLDERKIAQGARLVHGAHDFGLFCERPREQSSTRVVVEDVEVGEAGALILIRLVASHFLWKMVRRIVGALVRVGAGEIETGDLAALVDGSSPAALRGKPAEWTAPPSGLFLERVVYEGDAPIAALSPAFPVGEERAR